MKMNARQLLTMTDDQAREMLERIRWPEGPICPHCGSMNATKLNGKSTRPGLHKCKEKGCRKQFTVTVGTIFHRSHIGLGTWIYATWRICASKKGISALQLQRETGLTYKSAWFMCHRIREAMRREPLASMLSGDVEVDEAYCGGKPRHKVSHAERARRRKAGNPVSYTKKTPIIALVERNGRARTQVLCNVTAANLKKHVVQYVDKTSVIHTDEGRHYQGIGDHFKGGHKAVNHTEGEYARKSDGAGINTAESHFVGGGRAKMTIEQPIRE